MLPPAGSWGFVPVSTGAGWPEKRSGGKFRPRLCGLAAVGPNTVPGCPQGQGAGCKGAPWECKWRMAADGYGLRAHDEELSKARLPPLLLSHAPWSSFLILLLCLV